MAGPLEGLKVLELLRVPPGAFCTMMLADMGAEVVKIETPVAATPEQMAQAERQAAFEFVNRAFCKTVESSGIIEGKRLT